MDGLYQLSEIRVSIHEKCFNVLIDVNNLDGLEKKNPEDVKKINLEIREIR